MITVCPVKLLHMSYVYEYEALFRLQSLPNLDEAVKVAFGTQAAALKLRFEVLKEHNKEHWDTYKLVNPFDNLENKE